MCSTIAKAISEQAGKRVRLRPHAKAYKSSEFISYLMNKVMKTCGDRAWNYITDKHFEMWLCDTVPLLLYHACYTAHPPDPNSDCWHFSIQTNIDYIR